MTQVSSERIYKAYKAAKKLAERNDEGRINLREVKVAIAEKFDISLKELSIIIELERGQAISLNEHHKKSAKLPTKRKN